MSEFILVDNLELCLADELSQALKIAESLDVAAAYFSAGGYELILDAIEDLLERGGPVRFLFGVHPSAGARALLATLRAAQDRYGPERVAVRFIPPSEDRDFHAKVYIAKQGALSTLIVGSSNLSRPGLAANLELNYREVVATDSEKLRLLSEWFEVLFQREAREYRWETIEEIFTLPPFEPRRSTAALTPPTL
ncbi:MAG: phospholipase D-like domain-containing protein, partial [Blastocatellia bacterium]